MTTKPEQCCDEPRGFVGGICDHCGGEVQHEFTHLELEQQVSDWRSRAYKLETSLRLIEEILSSGVTNDVCFWGIREELEKYKQ